MLHSQPAKTVSPLTHSDAKARRTATGTKGWVVYQGSSKKKTEQGQSRPGEKKLECLALELKTIWQQGSDPDLPSGRRVDW